MLIQRCFYKIKYLISSRRRKIVHQYEHTKPYSIISCNCIGGLLYHDFEKQFLSPTINLFIESPDFIKLCQNLKEYMESDVVELKTNQKYPIGLLKDIKIHFLHYKSFDEAREKWNERKKRIDWNNIFVIMSDRDNFKEELVEQFLSLPYKKVLFSHKDYKQTEIVFVERDKNKKEVADLTKYFNLKGVKVYEYYFDFDKWLTGNFSTGECKR